MTIAFKDLKKIPVPNIIKALEELPVLEEINFNQLSLLKRIEGKWQIIKTIDFGGK